MGFGSILQEARLRQQLTLEDAERATKIRRVFLEALEAERFDLLPAKVFTQGFLRLYARYLGLDQKPLLQMLPPEPVPAIPPPLPPKPSPLMAWLPLGLGILIVGLIGLYLFQEAANAANPGGLTTVDQQTYAPPPLRRASVPAPSETPDAPAAQPASPIATAPPPPTPTPIPRITLSSVAGMEASQAMQRLQGAGVVVALEERWSATVAAGRVIGQEPAPNTTLERGGSVTIIVSKGPEGILVPNVVGRPEAEARRLLTESGLKVFQYSNFQGLSELTPQVLGRVCIGCVLSTTPPPEQRVQPGAEVFIAVRKE